MSKGDNTFLSVIIINYNGGDYLKRTLDSLEKDLVYFKYPAEILVVDNASTDNSLASIAGKYSQVEIISLSQNLGYARAANLGAKRSRGQYLLFLNNDVEILPGLIEKLISFLLAHPDYAAVAPAVLNPDGSFQLSFGSDLNFFSEFFLKFFAQKWYGFVYRYRSHKLSRDVDWASGVALLVRREVFFQIGGFDERYFLYVEDADLGLRLRRAGYKIKYLAAAKIIHYRGVVASQLPHLALREAKKGQLLYYYLHRGRLSFLILKIYLLSQFRLKTLFTYLTRNKRKRSIYTEVIQAIKGFTPCD